MVRLRAIKQVYRLWQGKVSVNTTKVVIQSINTKIEFFIFLSLHVSVLMGPSSGTYYDRTIKVI
jgi:hypothetical protein